jgi:hypothetical protein
MLLLFTPSYSSHATDSQVGEWRAGNRRRRGVWMRRHGHHTFHVIIGNL